MVFIGLFRRLGRVLGIPIVYRPNRGPRRLAQPILGRSVFRQQIGDGTFQSRSFVPNAGLESPASVPNPRFSFAAAQHERGCADAG